MLQLLEAKLAREPNHADTWRLLGQVKFRQGDKAGALAAVERALSLDPASAAAHFEMGRMIEKQRPRAAAAHFQEVVRLAPESDYAKQASERPRFLPNSAPAIADDQVTPAGYDVRTFDGSDELEDQIDRFDAAASEAPSAQTFRMESGALYNTNVLLTPTSRELAANELASYQGFINPELEQKLFARGGFSTGLVAKGYFSFNENEFSDFNLQSYQGGAFAQRAAPWGDWTLLNRADYLYTLDQFDGHTFGERHSVTVSTSLVSPGGNVSFMYYSFQDAAFETATATPEIDSLDGPSHTLGLSHSFFVDRWYMKTFDIGFDLEAADTEGADFRYRGGSLFAASTIPLPGPLSLALEGGWGYREYYDFTGSPSRNESLPRAKARLNWRLSDQWSIAGVFNYQAFDSDNPAFNSDRWVSGIVTTFVR